MFDYNMKPFRFWCQKVLPLVYDDSLSYYEVLCKVVNYLNHIMEDISQLPEYIQSLISDDKLKEIISGILDELREQIASANEGTSTTATADRDKGTLVWLDGKLYQATRDILAGDRYVEASEGVTGNVIKVTIEDILNALIKNVLTNSASIETLNSNIGDLTSLTTEEKSNIVSAINELVLSILANTTNIGTIDNLETSIKTDLVSAINELVSSITSINSNIGDLDNLETTTKDSIVASINEVVGDYETLSEGVNESIEAINTIIDNTKIVNVLDYGVKGDGTTDDTDALQAIVNTYDVIYLPKGEYLISEPIIVPPNKTIFGAGKLTVLKTSQSFTSVNKAINEPAITVTLNGVFSLYNASWVNNGSVIRSLSIQCNNRSDGIDIVNHASNTIIEKVYIDQPKVGIKNIRNGWGHVYDKCYITRAVFHSIELSYAANGCSITDCQLYGQGVDTQIHVYVHDQSYGNVIKGGFIEGCLRGLYLFNDAQCSMIGCDMEGCKEAFIWTYGNHDSYTGLPTDPYNPPCKIEGCSFVNTVQEASQSYIVRSDGGLISVDSCVFINWASSPVAVFSQNGDVTDKNSIGVMNCTFRGFTTAYTGRQENSIPYISAASIKMYDATLAKYVAITVNNGQIVITPL